MAYIPKNKIKTNLFTNGKEYTIEETQIEYLGYFYKLYNGETYTGKFPGDGENKKLIPSRPKSDLEIIPSLNTSSIPPLYPTPDDYKNGMFVRYFFKKRNEYLFEELTKDRYNQLNNPNSNDYTLYQPFFIKWMLTGDEKTVANYNFYSIRNAEEKEGVIGLNDFLKMDYLKYYK